MFCILFAENFIAGRGNDQHVGVRANGRRARVLDVRNAVQVRVGRRTGRVGGQQSARQDAEIGPVRIAEQEVQVRRPGARGRRQRCGARGEYPSGRARRVLSRFNCFFFFFSVCLIRAETKAPRTQCQWRCDAGQAQVDVFSRRRR